MGSRGNRKARKHLMRGAVAREAILRSASIATETEITLPDDERVVLTRKPAKIGEEVVGEAIIYEDGTTDILLNDDISEEARQKLRSVVMAFNEEAGASFTVKDIIGKEV